MLLQSFSRWFSRKLGLEEPLANVRVKGAKFFLQRTVQDLTGKSPAGTHTQTPPTRLDWQVAGRDTHTNPTYKTRLANHQQGHVHTHKPHLQTSNRKSLAGTHTHKPLSTSKSPTGSRHTESVYSNLHKSECQF